MSYDAEVIAAMRAYGLDPGNAIQWTGKKVRFPGPGESRRTKNGAGWYYAFPDHPPNVQYGCWKSGVDTAWWPAKNGKREDELDPAQWAELQAHREAKEREREEGYARAAEECRIRWENASEPSPGHPYLEKKGITTFPNLRQEGDGVLIVRMTSFADGNPVVSLQTINAQGEKRFVTGARALGSRCTIGGAHLLHRRKNARKTDLYICEGYATGWSIYRATNSTVVVAFSTANLMAVAKALREKYGKDQSIVICADNDRWSLTHRGPNPGVIYAQEAAKEIDAFLAIPDFEDLSTKPTDFNDLMLLEGLDAVKEWLDPGYSELARIVAEPGDGGLEPTPLEKEDQPPPPLISSSLRGEDGSSPARSFEELLREANSLCQESRPDDIEALVGESISLKPMQRSRLFDAIKRSTGFTLSTIREVFAVACAVTKRREEPDHLDLARRVVDELGLENILATESHIWIWEGRGVWRPQGRRALLSTVQASLEQDPVLHLTRTLVESVSEVLTTAVYRPGHTFNIGATDVVNCLNGELHLEADGWTLRPHDRESYRTVQVPVCWDPKAEAPQFEKFLTDVFHGERDAEQKATALLEAMGYTLQTHTRFELFVVLIGPGSNGKSVFLAVLEAVLGSDNVAGVQPAQFENRFQRSHLHLKLADIVSELREGEVIADAELKAITSGELMTVEEKFCAPFDMRPYSTCWFGANHLPRTRDFSDAMFRRALVVPFNRRFWKTEDERSRWGEDSPQADPNLRQKLLQEIPGIFRLALEAYASAVDCGSFTEPSSCLEAKRKWRLEADQVSQFVEELCEVTSGSEEAVDILFRAYRKWAEASGVTRTLGKIAFGNRLEMLGYQRGRTSAERNISGITLTAQGHAYTSRQESLGAER